MRKSLLTFFRPASVILVLVLAIGSFLPAAPVQAAGDSISLGAYRQLIEDTLALIDTLRPESDEAAAAGLNEIAGDWESVTAVELPDGERLPVDTAYVVTLLQTFPPDLDRLEGHLIGLQALAESWPEYLYAAEDTDSLEEILKQPEYQWPEQEEGPVDSLINRFLNWVYRLFSEVLNFGGIGRSMNLRWLYYLGSAVFIAVLLYYIFQGTIGSLVSEAALEGAEGQGEENLTSEGAFRQAQQLSSRGDTRVAVRYLYLAALLLLEEKGLLHYDRAKTNQEYVQGLSGHPGLLKPLRKVVNVFDRVWYGFRDIDDESYAEYEREVEQLRKQE